MAGAATNAGTGTRALAALGLVVVLVAAASCDAAKTESAAPSPAATSVCDRVAAPDGSDWNAGTATSPYLTPQKLADTLEPGETGCLRAGSYSASGTHILTIRRGGFRIRSYPGERARLIGIVYVQRSAPGVTLSHLDVEGTGSQNTIQVHAADAVVEDSIITNEGRGRSCLILGDNAGYGDAARAVVRRNRFHDCGAAANGNKDHGIYAANVTDAQILDNVFWNTAAYAVHLYPNSRRTRVAHNVVDGGGIIVGGDSSYTSDENVVELNVVVYSERYNIETYWESTVGSGNIVRSNCLWAGGLGNVSATGLTLEDNLVADPHFADRDERDYTLAEDSDCRSLLASGP